ncbi:MAG: class I SAM-dependent methyltransferase, partial [Betaproteobacteria bacterium]
TSSIPRDYAEVTRATALQFPAYVHDLVAKLSGSGIGANDLVLEVGANDGMFLDVLRTAGFRRVVGVEPSQQLATAARARGHSVVCDYFGPDLVPRLASEFGAARAVICRHTLEHVPEPLGFVRALRQCLADEGSIALVEIPDGSAIPDLMNVYELWDEHLSYFSPGNFRRLLASGGLCVGETAVQPHLDTRNLLAWCRPSSAASGPAQTESDRHNVALWQSLPPRWGRFVAGFDEALRSAPGPVYTIGASHSQSNLINFSGVGHWVDSYIDDDTAKLGRLPPVGEARSGISSTADFERTAPSGSLVTTGFGYPRWTERLRAHAVAHGMTIVDPQLFFSRHGQYEKVA